MPDENGYTLLGQAASNGKIDFLNLFIDFTADLNIQDSEGYTALARAVFHDHIECIQILITSGADINIGDKDDRTPFALAALRGHMSCVSILFESETNTNRQSKFNQLYQKKIKPICSSLLILGRNLISRIELIAHSVIKFFTIQNKNRYRNQCL